MDKQKKIFLFGGTAAMCEVVETAKRMGLYTIVIDYYPNSPAKKLADRAYLVSTTDYDAVLKIAKENEVDGIFAGIADVNLLPAKKIADSLGLPFYATEEQIEITTNKLLFKKTCREYDIPVVPEYALDGELRAEDLAKVQYPVIVKPTDAYSCKGVSVCKDEAELRSAVQYALGFSRAGRVIVERYMAEFPDVCMYLNIQNGVLSFAAMCERDMNLVQDGKAMQPNALFYPCRFIPLYYEQLEKKLSNMVSGLGMRDGVMFMQCFVADGVLMPFEMGYRICGAQEYILCSAENGINSLEMMLNYSVTGKFEGWDAAACNKPVFNHTDVILLTLLRPGKIARIEGLDQLLAMPEILKVVQFYREGEEVSEVSMGTLNQTFARIFIQGKDPQNLLELIEHVQNTLKIYAEQGNNMIMPGYDCKRGHILKTLD